MLLGKLILSYVLKPLHCREGQWPLVLITNTLSGNKINILFMSRDYRFILFFSSKGRLVIPIYRAILKTSITFSIGPQNL
jgi:hypothetical protein